MMSGNRAAKRAEKAGLNGYLLTWLVLASVALGYIGVAASRPELIAALLPVADRNGDQIAVRNAADIVDEIVSLRKWINDLQHELQATKTTVSAQADQSKALLQRLAAAEERLQVLREIRAEGAVPPPPAGKQALVPKSGAAKVAQAPAAAEHAADRKVDGGLASAIEAAEAKVQEPHKVAEATRSDGLKVINQSITSGITTGSIKPAAPAPAAPPASAAAPAPAQMPVQAAGPARGIEIADAESLDGLRSRWMALSAQNAGTLKKLEPRYRISANGSGNPFTLLAGPFTNPAEAQKACAQLKASGVACRVSDYSGNNL